MVRLLRIRFTGAGRRKALELGEDAVVGEPAARHPRSVVMGESSGEIEEIKPLADRSDLTEGGLHLGGGADEVASPVKEPLETVPHPRQIDAVHSGCVELRRQAS